MNKHKGILTVAAKELKCSMCGQPLDDSDFKPFCSRRCQQLDLGNWLNERYGLPYEDERAPMRDGSELNDDNSPSQ